ncbi:MAG: hypothetical protein NT033_00625, partial [Candidatus Omnitrophica bacterium]|nr:hypothetical protein [Candidatus Omnitrophota bacterium]
MGYVRDYYKKVPDAKEPPSVVDLASVHGLDTTTIYAFLKRSGLSYEELGIRRERSPTTNMKRKRRSPEEWVELVKELRARLAEKFNTEYLVYPTTATNLAMVAEPSEDVTSKVLSEAKAKHKAMLGALISQRASSEPHVVLSKFNDKIHAILQEMIRSPEDVLPEKIQELAVFVKLSPGTVKKLFASLLRNRFFKAEVILERGERRWDFIRRVLQTYVDLVHNNEVKINAPSPVAERSPGVLTGIT